MLLEYIIYEHILYSAWFTAPFLLLPLLASSLSLVFPSLSAQASFSAFTFLKCWVVFLHSFRHIFPVWFDLFLYSGPLKLCLAPFYCDLPLGSFSLTQKSLFSPHIHSHPISFPPLKRKVHTLEILFLHNTFWFLSWTNLAWAVSWLEKKSGF